LVLPKKKWFGNNFSSGFLDTRVSGLQTFINTILGNPEMRNYPYVREFFCLDDPPFYSESSEECKAIFEAQEETIAHLKMQLKAKDEVIGNLSQELYVQQKQNEYLMKLVKYVFGFERNFLTAFTINIFCFFSQTSKLKTGFSTKKCIKIFIILAATAFFQVLFI
jgi:hypothetical protein